MSRLGQGNLFRMVLTGDKALQVALQKLGVRTEQKIARKATVFALTPIVKAVKKSAPRGPSGLLQHSVNKRVKLYRRRGVTVGVVGHRTRLKARIRGRLESPTFYAHIVEGGSRAHRIPRRGSTPMPVGRGRVLSVIRHPGTVRSAARRRSWATKRSRRRRV
jgi:hypothetical protein